MSKLPHLYSKLIEMMEGTTDRGRTDTDRVRIEVCRKFRISSDDIDACMKEMEKKHLLTRVKRKNDRPTIQMTPKGLPLIFKKQAMV